MMKAIKCFIQVDKLKTRKLRIAPDEIPLRRTTPVLASQTLLEHIVSPYDLHILYRYSIFVNHFTEFLPSTKWNNRHKVNQNLVTFGFVYNLDIISCSWHFGIYRLFSARLHSPFCVFRWLECREDGVARDVWAVRVFGREIFVYHQISKNVQKYRLHLLHIIHSFRFCQRQEIVQFTSSNFND